jgi:ABC-type bacteriocin/lantibiotic exporter with double-glycine peptidase domain
MSTHQKSNNIIFDLLLTYLQEEKLTAILLVILSLIVNGIQAHGISRITAEMVQSIENVNREKTIRVLYYLCFAFFVFLIMSYLYKRFQNNLLTKMRQWLRYNMLNILLKSNKENMDEINFPRISSPINRTASVCFMLFNIIFSMILPDTSFVLIVAGFLLLTRLELGAIFLTGNLIITAIIALNWNTMYEKNKLAVETEYDNEASLLEIMHNFDKIIYRGQTEYESRIFENKSKEAFEKALDFQKTVENYCLSINLLVSIIVAVLLWSIISAFYSKEISATYFITVMTMLVLYRDKMYWGVQILPDCVEFVGRTNTVLKHFKDISLDHVENEFEPKDLPFHRIEFKDVAFRYKASATDVVSGMSLQLDTSKHDIIGITGLSGKGKSTIMKILLKMHTMKEGSVYIDGVNIDEISPDYIRKNITYVSQNGKLFDRVILENIMYGCSHPETCAAELQKVLRYQKVRDLFKNIDIENKRSGNLGENLSGGQRQVVNIIGGLINPSKILVLDEPTNALDSALKLEIMRLIQDYSKTKNAILIITHDKEMMPIFDTVVKL